MIQGGILSAALFNLAYFPAPPLSITLIKYDDEITIHTSGPVVAEKIYGLNIYMSQVLICINSRKLTVSKANFTVTYFRPDTHEHHIHPQVKLADQVLPLQKKPKWLEVMLDTHLPFTPHSGNIAVKCINAICWKHWPGQLGAARKKPW